MQTPSWYGSGIVPEKLNGEPRKVLVVHKLPDDTHEVSTGYWLSQAQWIIEGKLQPAWAVRCWTFLPEVPQLDQEDLTVPVEFHEARFTPPADSKES
jgi:hypothetical protein